MHTRFSRLPTTLCTFKRCTEGLATWRIWDATECDLLWQNWGKMAQAVEDRNASIFQKWAFCEEDCIHDTLERSERWGLMWDNSVVKSEEQGLCQIGVLGFVLSRSQQRTLSILKQVALFCMPKCMYQSDVVGLDFCEADRQCDQSNSDLRPGKGVRCPRLG